jgi:hypothetical protein
MRAIALHRCKLELHEEGFDVKNGGAETAVEEADAPVLLVRDDGFFRPENPWRGAGVAAPVFSLRTRNSVGAGDFCDLKTLVDFCVATGLGPQLSSFRFMLVCVHAPAWCECVHVCV